MAGFGKSLLGAITGAAEGYGNYLQMEGKQRLDMEQEERQSQRAMALEQFRAGIQSDRDTAEDARARGRIVLTGLVNRENSVTEIGARSAADAVSRKRDMEDWKVKNGITFETWRKQQGISLSNDKAKIAYEKQMEAQYAAEKDGFDKIGDEIDSETGTTVYHFKNNKGEVRTYDTGLTPQAKPIPDPLNPGAFIAPPKPTGKTKQARAGWRDGPEASGGGERSNLQVVMDQLATDYGSGKPVTYQGRKLSLQEAQAAARRRYGG